MQWSDYIVWFVVAVAAWFALRHFWRLFSGKSKGCGGCDKQSTCDKKKV